jgi:3-(3-hydroxy-phenyl)propionate hydroxylase
VALQRVLVAGAGPVGLTCALVLARGGVPVTVFEREPDLAEDLRASTWHPPTLDMLAELGLADEMLQVGLKSRYTQYRDRQSGAIAEFDLELLRGETDHPYRLQYEQFRYTRLVLERLKAFSHVEVRFGRAVASVSQNSAGVDVALETADRHADRPADRHPDRHRGDYLIGADGGRSAVRETLGIEFEGFTFPERFYSVSTKFDFASALERLSHVNYIADVDEWYVLLKVPGFWRSLFPTRVDEDDEAVLSESSTQTRLHGVFARPQPYEVFHRTIYRVHQRVARQYRVGSVFLAGDAAHLNNPLGGMGMNGGLHDAINLTGKLVAIHRGEADDKVLDRYEPERRPIAIDYINANTARNKKVMEERDPEARKRAQDEMCRIAADPIAAKAFLMRSSMIDALRAVPA